MHTEAYAFVEKAVRARGPFVSVAEIGGRDVNGSVRPLFDHARYVSVDVREGPGVDVVADAERWLEQRCRVSSSDLLDCVVCCEVLEHAENAEQLVRKSRWVLRHGGTFIMTCATDPRAPHSAVDGDLIEPGDEYYLNVMPEEMRRWCERYSSVELEVDETHGDLYAVAVR